MIKQFTSAKMENIINRVKVCDQSLERKDEQQGPGKFSRGDLGGE